MPAHQTDSSVHPIRPRLAGSAVVLALASACSGGLGHRSMAVMEGTIPVPEVVSEVRCEIASGSVRVLVGEGRQITFQGGLRRAGNTAELLTRIEQVPPTLTAAPDADRPEVLVLRGPALPSDVAVGEAILGFEVTLTLPADLALGLTVAESGHLVVEDRRAAVRMSTQHGDLRLMRCQGPARIHTGRGMTIVYDHCGQLDVESGVGDVQVVVREPGPLLRLVTGIGNLQCLVPPDVGFRLDARTESGRVANGFGIVKERLSGQGAAMSGSRGDGRTEIVMRAGTGFLSLSYKTFD